MKRAILILAVAAFFGAAGCGRCDRETLTVNWTFRDSSGQPISCDASGTSTIRVFLDGVAAVDRFNRIDFTCAESPNGIQLFDVPVGVNTVEVDTFDASGGLIIQNQQTVQVQSCGDTSVVLDLSALRGNIDIDFQFPDIGFTCSNQDTLMWYELLDWNNQVVDIVGPNNTPGALPCVAGPILLSQLPFGRYTVSRIQEVDGVGFASHHATCTPQSFEHLAADETVTVIVPFSTGTCF